MQKRKCLL